MDEDNAILLAHFLKDEGNEAIFLMEHDKSSCPDRFHAKVYQHCWDMIKDDLI